MTLIEWVTRILLLVVPGVLVSGCQWMADDLRLTPPNAIAAPSLRPFADGTNWIVERDVVFRYPGWPEIRVPKGFVTDLASVPALAQAIRSRVGTYSRAAILHDYLYWSGRCTRDQADVIFYHAMKTSGSTDVVAGQVYFAVSKFGKPAYATNRIERQAGMMRILTPEQYDLADVNGWLTLRKTLPTVTPAADELPPHYCALGNNMPTRKRERMTKQR